MWMKFSKTLYRNVKSKLHREGYTTAYQVSKSTINTLEDFIEILIDKFNEPSSDFVQKEQVTPLL